MRIAIIGAGVSGLGAALSLKDRPGVEITVFEKASRAGGHANTLDVDYDGQAIAVDTGFIVYNDLNYPNFKAFLDWAKVETVASDMSFALSAGAGRYEWSGQNSAAFNGFFAQRRNLVSPAHWMLLRDILRFQKVTRADVAAGSVGEGTLGQYLDRHAFSAALRDNYIAPMGAAIWSMTPGEALQFPAASFLNFFENHHLLQWDRPVWRTIADGSRSYVRAIRERLGADIKLGLGAKALRRTDEGVELRDSAGSTHRFDATIIATHAPQALTLLSDASEAERAVLGACRTSVNLAVLHRDPALMPRRKAAWAAWNVLLDQPGGPAAVTYWMNRLQPLPADRPLFVTLNPVRPPAADRVFASVKYRHPLYDAAALEAQRRLPTIQGRNKVWFCGAWTSYGFHEDGMASGLAAGEALGGLAPWKRSGS